MVSVGLLWVNIVSYSAVKFGGTVGSVDPGRALYLRPGCGAAQAASGHSGAGQRRGCEVAGGEILVQTRQSSCNRDIAFKRRKRRNSGSMEDDLVCEYDSTWDTESDGDELGDNPRRCGHDKNKKPRAAFVRATDHNTHKLAPTCSLQIIHFSAAFLAFLVF